MREGKAEAFEWQPTSRSARWYEWLLILLLLGLVGGVRAESVYKCTESGGDVAYQSQPCAGQQRTGVIEIAPAPAFAASPQYAIAPASSERSSRVVSRSRSAGRREATGPTSYECRASDGQVFYRHGSCPHAIPAGSAPIGSTSRRGKPSAQGKAASVSVSSQRIPRDDACREIHGAGRIGRAGHEHDENVSTYEHNLGRDPCR